MAHVGRTGPFLEERDLSICTPPMSRLGKYQIILQSQWFITPSSYVMPAYMVSGEPVVDHGNGTVDWEWDFTTGVGDVFHLWKRYYLKPTLPNRWLKSQMTINGTSTPVYDEEIATPGLAAWGGFFFGPVLIVSGREFRWLQTASSTCPWALLP